MQENQLAKMVAAAYNTHVNSAREKNVLSLTASEKSKDIPLYDKEYQKAVGVKIAFSSNVAVDKLNVDADVYYKRNNCVFVSLNGGARVSADIHSRDINITSVNRPASIRTDENTAVIRFYDGGMMSASVSGDAETSSKGWSVEHRDGTTIFRKYGKADTLKISK